MYGKAALIVFGFSLLSFCKPAFMLTHRSNRVVDFMTEILLDMKIYSAVFSYAMELISVRLNYTDIVNSSWRAGAMMTRNCACSIVISSCLNSCGPPQHFVLLGEATSRMLYILVQNILQTLVKEFYIVR